MGVEVRGNVVANKSIFLQFKEFISGVDSRIAEKSFSQLFRNGDVRWNNLSYFDLSKMVTDSSTVFNRDYFNMTHYKLPEEEVIRKNQAVRIELPLGLDKSLLVHIFSQIEPNENIKIPSEVYNKVIDATKGEDIGGCPGLIRTLNSNGEYREVRVFGIIQDGIPTALVLY